MIKKKLKNESIPAVDATCFGVNFTKWFGGRSTKPKSFDANGATVHILCGSMKLNIKFHKNAEDRNIFEISINGFPKGSDFYVNRYVFIGELFDIPQSPDIENKQLNMGLNETMVQRGLEPTEEEPEL